MNRQADNDQTCRTRQRYKSTLFRQWGYKTNSSVVQVIINYPITFCVECFSGSVNYLNVDGEGEIGISSLNKGSMTAEIDGGKTGSKDIRWIAIGY